ALVPMSALEAALGRRGRGWRGLVAGAPNTVLALVAAGPRRGGSTARCGGGILRVAAAAVGPGRRGRLAVLGALGLRRQSGVSRSRRAPRCARATERGIPR